MAKIKPMWTSKIHVLSADELSDGVKGFLRRRAHYLTTEAGGLDFVTSLEVLEDVRLETFDDDENYSLDDLSTLRLLGTVLGEENYVRIAYD